jgi:hypothetical protein
VKVELHEFVISRPSVVLFVSTRLRQLDPWYLLDRVVRGNAIG